MFDAKIECHKVNPTFHLGDLQWRAKEGIREDGYEGRPFRTCSYCGSIHPDDLVAALNAGAQMHGSDWKYGWPHKFYVEGIPNPNQGQRVRTGSRCWTENGVGKEEIMWGTGQATTHAKWYNDHLYDQSDEQFRALAAILEKHTDIEFYRQDDKMGYRAPRPGYQR